TAQATGGCSPAFRAPAVDCRATIQTATARPSTPHRRPFAMTDPAPQAESQAAEPRALRLVSPFTARARKRRIAQAVVAGRLRLLGRVDLLAPEGLHSLARQSLWLLLVSGSGYIALCLTARTVQHAGPLLGTASPLLRALILMAANLASYAAILPLHEAVHAAVILALGGRPRFGLKLPFAAYCT